MIFNYYKSPISPLCYITHKPLDWYNTWMGSIQITDSNKNLTTFVYTLFLNSCNSYTNYLISVQVDPV